MPRVLLAVFPSPEPTSCLQEALRLPSAPPASLVTQSPQATPSQDRHAHLEAMEPPRCQTWAKVCARGRSTQSCISVGCSLCPPPGQSTQRPRLIFPNFTSEPGLSCLQSPQQLPETCKTKALVCYYVALLQLLAGTLLELTLCSQGTPMSFPRGSPDRGPGPGVPPSPFLGTHAMLQSNLNTFPMKPICLTNIPFSKPLQNLSSPWSLPEHSPHPAVCTPHTQCPHGTVFSFSLFVSIVLSHMRARPPPSLTAELLQSGSLSCHFCIPEKCRASHGPMGTWLKNHRTPQWNSGISQDPFMSLKVHVFFLLFERAPGLSVPTQEESHNTCLVSALCSFKGPRLGAHAQGHANWLGSNWLQLRLTYSADGAGWTRAHHSGHMTPHALQEQCVIHYAAQQGLPSPTQWNYSPWKTETYTVWKLPKASQGTSFPPKAQVCFAT